VRFLPRVAEWAALLFLGKSANGEARGGGGLGARRDRSGTNKIARGNFTAEDRRSSLPRRASKISVGFTYAGASPPGLIHILQRRCRREMGRFICLFLSAPSAGLVDADAVPAVIGMAVVRPHSVFVSHDQGFPVLGANKPDKGSFPTYSCSSVNSFVGNSHLR
jgi:hypothetical protein